MVKEITKRVKLDFSKLRDLNSAQRKIVKEAIKKEVGNAIVDDIKDFLSQSKSPVKQGSFKKRKKDGDPSILRETGDMWKSIEARTYRDGIDIGIWEPDEVPKADNHNKNSAASRKTAVPQREFIPKKNNDFRNDIQKKINRIIRERAKEAKGS